MVADQVAHVAHLNARDTTLVFVSRAPQSDIARLKARMGWHMPWYSVTDSFDKEFGVDQWHGTNAFIRDGAQVFRTYFVNNRGDEAMGGTWACGTCIINTGLAGSDPSSLSWLTLSCAHSRMKMRTSSGKGNALWRASYSALASFFDEGRVLGNSRCMTLLLVQVCSWDQLEAFSPASEPMRDYFFQPPLMFA